MTVRRTAALSPPRERVADGAAELQRFANAGRLASAVARDLLTALGVAQTDVGFLRELLDQPERRVDLRLAADDARAALTRAVARISAVLSLARERKGEVAPLDVNEVIRAALFDLEPRLSACTLVANLEPVPFALAERGALLQTLVSVLLDAADSTPAHGRIVIKLRAESGWVLISIDDEGPSPIAPESLAYRVGSPLWICRNVLRAFGGELLAGQGQLCGKRVTLKLPTERVSP